MIGAADAKGESLFLHFEKPTDKDLKVGSKNLDLNKLMQNIGAPQFDFGTFKAAYDTDARVKTMVKNFDKTGIEPKTKNTIKDEPVSTDKPEGGDSVGAMAKRATDVGAKL